MINANDAEEFVRTLVAPAVVFLSVTALRKIINRPRPYEALKINPLIKKNTVGQSFPSRHSASVFIIAIVCYPINICLGVALTIVGITICISRILAGVHYISDVLFGALYSIILGILSIFLI
ncbi:MAG: phosphatase PAP2 family protein [Ruminococcus sp.]|nr:phosphatase PAP2 family protein [Ruminococcus sp.]